MKSRHKIRSSVLNPAIPIHDGPLGSVFLIILSLGLLFLSASDSRLTSGLRINMQDVFAPGIAAMTSPVEGFALFVRDVTALAELRAENLALRGENQKLRQWYHRAMVLNHENAQLRGLLKMPLETVKNTTTARVLIDAASPYAKTLLIDAGRVSGVSQTNLAVLSGEGLIGRIIELGDKTARVLLINDISSRVPVIIEGSGEQAILAGQNTSTPSLMHSANAIFPKDGMRVLTSGVGGVYPAGIPIGQVRYAQGSGEDIPFVALYADLDSLLYVRIVEKAE